MNPGSSSPSAESTPSGLLETLVLVGDFPPGQQRLIDRVFRCVNPADAVADDGLRRSVRGIVTQSNFEVPLAVVDALPSLRVIATCGVGFDKIPVAAAQQRGIVVTHTPGVLDAAVCELGIGLLLALLRDIPAADRHVRDGAWRTTTYPLATSLAGQRVGIVGLGRIGQGFARRLEAFDVSLAYAGRRRSDSPYRHFPDALALAAEVDIMIISCRGGAATHHLIDARVLDALGAGWLVNVARGSVVDEAALCRALTDGALRGAALDVFEQEPLGDSPLCRLPNVVLSPHAGSATHETRAAMLQLTLDNLHAVLAGRAAVTPVPPAH